MPTIQHRIRATTLGVFALGTLLTAFSVFPTRTAHADSYTITPPKYELFANPGDTLSEKLKVRNDSDTDITYQVEIQDFTANGDDGSINLVDPTAPRETFSLAKWITTEPSKFTIPAGQESVVSFTIKVPQSGEPGGHYASILIKRAGQATAGGAQVDSRVGSLILLRVSGNITEKLSLESFNAASGFQQYGPIGFNMRFKNDGNVHVAPTGTIVITNIFGKKVKEIPFTPSNVLPGANRVIKANWDEKGLVGRYTASLVISYGQNKQTITGSTTFVVFPLYLLVIIIVFIILLYLMIAKRKSLKRLINNLTRE